MLTFGQQSGVYGNVYKLEENVMQQLVASKSANVCRAA